MSDIILCLSNYLFYFALVLAGQCGKVWVTVSSLWRPIAACDKVVDAELEINWEFDCLAGTRYSDTQIKVFTADPLAAHSNKFCLLLLRIVFRC